MQRSVGLISLGCPKNLVDSEIMLGILGKEGWRIVTDPKKATVLIVNTCGFIEDAKRESIETVLEMARFKEEGRVKYLVVTGCLPQRYKDELLDLFPEVDLFVGTGEYHQIAKLLGAIEGRKEKPKACRIGVPEFLHTSKTPRRLATACHAVYIKVAEGCFHGCSFCSIPKMRGRFRSRQAGDIVEEAKHLIAHGAKELNLIAQDTTAYGRDLAGGENIVTLLEKISAISGEKWIRMLYSYPQSFKKGIVKLMRRERDICRYIDIPIQHIDDNMLFKMRRGRSEKLIRSLVDDIKAELPELALRTTVITGFPGETERQFMKLLRFVEEGHFDHLGAFTYSEEEGTGAARMKGHLPEKVKRGRQLSIMKAQKRVSRKRLRVLRGKRLKVLVTGPSGETEHLLEGRTEHQAPDIDGVVYINEGRAEAGSFNMVEITDSYDYDVVGRIV